MTSTGITAEPIALVINRHGNEPEDIYHLLLFLLADGSRYRFDSGNRHESSHNTNHSTSRNTP